MATGRELYQRHVGVGMVKPRKLSVQFDARHVRMIERLKRQHKHESYSDTIRYCVEAASGVKADTPKPKPKRWYQVWKR